MSDPNSYPYGGSDFPDAYYCNRCKRVDCWLQHMDELDEILKETNEQRETDPS